MKIKATIHDTGHGLAAAGEIVSGSDGRRYRVSQFRGCVLIDREGRQYAHVYLVDTTDASAEPRCSAAVGHRARRLARRRAREVAS